MSALGDIAPAVQRRPRAALVGPPVLAAILGALLAVAFGQGSGTPPPRAAPAPTGAALAAGDLRVTLPPGWTRSRTAEPMPGFGGARAIHARAGHAAVTIALLPAQRESLLPPALGTAPPRPSAAHAGAIRAYHYVLPTTRRGIREVVAAPTTQGVATIACSAAARGACERILHGLRLAKGAFVGLGANAAFLARLPAAARALDAQHLRTRERLARTTDPDEAARAAARLATAYAATARTLRPLVTRPSGHAAATVDLLDRLRSDYARLAYVVRRGDGAAFKPAATAIDADEARLAARLQAWQVLLSGPAAG